MVVFEPSQGGTPLWGQYLDWVRTRLPHVPEQDDHELHGVHVPTENTQSKNKNKFEWIIYIYVFVSIKYQDNVFVTLILQPHSKILNRYSTNPWEFLEKYVFWNKRAKITNKNNKIKIKQDKQQYLDR